MIPKITKILYATDLSANSAVAFCYAVNLAEKHNARMTILHVLDNLTGTAQTLITSHSRLKWGKRNQGCNNHYQIYVSILVG